MTDLAFAPVHELIHLLKMRQVSPRELVEVFLERIARLNPTLNAFLTVAEDQARRAAAEAETLAARTRDLPPLSGVPVAVKDLEFTKGLRSTGGSLPYREFMPREDSVVVERLRRAALRQHDASDHPVESHRPACRLPALRVHGQRPARGTTGCRPPWRRLGGVAGFPGVRKNETLAHQDGRLR